MTWGQIRRHVVQTIAADLPLSLVTDYLNLAFEEILGSQKWEGQKRQTSIAVAGVHTDGTIAVDAGSVAVSGDATAWTAGMGGGRIKFAGRDESYTVAYVSATDLELDRAFEGATIPGDGGYWLYAVRFTLPERLIEISSMSSSRGFPVTYVNREQLDRIDPLRSRDADSPFRWTWAEEVLPDADGGPGNKAIEVWPAPSLAQSLMISYREKPIGCTNDSLSLNPPDWIDTGALLNRAKAFVVENHPTRDGQPRGDWKAFMGAYDMGLTNMSNANNRRTGPVGLRTRYGNPLRSMR